MQRRPYRGHDTSELHQPAIISHRKETRDSVCSQQKQYYSRSRLPTLSSTLAIFFSTYSLSGSVTSTLLPVTRIGALLLVAASATACHGTGQKVWY